MNDHQHDVIAAIAYSRLITKTFTASECILLHQWAHHDRIVSIELMQKYKNIHHTIKTTKWEKPEFKYNEQFDLFYRYSGNVEWIKI